MAPFTAVRAKHIVSVSIKEILNISDINLSNLSEFTSNNTLLLTTTQPTILLLFLITLSIQTTNLSTLSLNLSEDSKNDNSSPTTKTLRKTLCKPTIRST